MRAVLRTLAQCHARNVLHRDIKPGAGHGGTAVGEGRHMGPGISSQVRGHGGKSLGKGGHMGPGTSSQVQGTGAHLWAKVGTWAQGHQARCGGTGAQGHPQASCGVKLCHALG